MVAEKSGGKSLDPLVDLCYFLKPVLNSETSYLQEVEKLKDWYIPPVMEKLGRVFGKFDKNYALNSTNWYRIVNDFIILSDLVDLSDLDKKLLKLDHQSSFLAPSRDILGTRLGLGIAAGSELLNFCEVPAPAVLHCLAAGGLLVAGYSLFLGTARQDYEFLKETAQKTDKSVLDAHSHGFVAR